MGVTQELCFSTLAMHLCSATAPAHLLISFLFEGHLLFLYCIIQIYDLKGFFFFLCFLGHKQLYYFCIQTAIFCLIFGMRQTVMQRWGIWVEVQGKHCGLCAQSPFASGTLEALFSASGFGEKLLKSHCSTEQSVTLGIIVC